VHTSLPTIGVIASAVPMPNEIAASINRLVEANEVSTSDSCLAPLTNWAGRAPSSEETREFQDRVHHRGGSGIGSPRPAGLRAADFTS